MPLLKPMILKTILRDSWRLLLLVGLLLAAYLAIHIMNENQRRRHQQARVQEVTAAIKGPVSEFALQDADRRLTREAHTNAHLEGKLDALQSTPDAGLVPWYLDTLSELRSDAQDARGYGPGPGGQ